MSVGYEASGKYKKAKSTSEVVSGVHVKKVKFGVDIVEDGGKADGLVPNSTSVSKYKLGRSRCVVFVPCGAISSEIKHTVRSFVLDMSIAMWDFPCFMFWNSRFAMLHRRCQRASPRGLKIKLHLCQNPKQYHRCPSPKFITRYEYSFKFQAWHRSRIFWFMIHVLGFWICNATTMMTAIEPHRSTGAKLHLNQSPSQYHKVPFWAICVSRIYHSAQLAGQIALAVRVAAVKTLRRP